MVSHLSYNSFQIANGSSSQNDDNPSHAIQICCAWNDKLADGVLTYKIDGGNSDSQQAINNAIEEWNSKIMGIKIEESTNDNTPADIDIKISSKSSRVTHATNTIVGDNGIADGKKIKLAQPGEAIISFDSKGLINHVDITVSTRALGSSFDTVKLESIAKHEIGHAYGIGHTDFANDLMSPILTDRTDTDLSECDINGIEAANQWKETSTANNFPHAPTLQFLRC